MLVEEYKKINKENADPRLEKYFETPTFQRQKGKGLFCGMDYVNVKEVKPIEYCSRFDHIQNVSRTASKLSSDFRVALAGALHDVGTYSFSHINSFKKGDILKQDSDELEIKTVLLKDEELLTYLDEDKINIDEVVDYKRYPLIDKSIPSLCLDRSDGILTTCLIWIHTHSIEEIRELYYMLTYFDSLNGMNFDQSVERLANFDGEMVLNEHYGISSYEDFFKAINNYSRILLSKESRYMSTLLGMALNYYEDMGVFTERDLFFLSEEEIINRILDSKYSDVWKDITSLEKVSYASDDTEGITIISKPKIRQANPLCFGQMEVMEIDGISGEFYRELNDLERDIKLTNIPITADLSKETVRMLIKYKK